jgi:hypothetical protein
VDVADRDRQAERARAAEEVEDVGGIGELAADGLTRDLLVTLQAAELALHLGVEFPRQSDPPTDEPDVRIEGQPRAVDHQGVGPCSEGPGHLIDVGHVVQLDRDRHRRGLGKPA